jgi:hypothetical protein
LPVLFPSLFAAPHQAGYTAIAIFGKIGPYIWNTSDGELAATRPFVGILVFCFLGLLVTATGTLKDNRT